MERIHDIAQLLVSSWSITSQGEAERAIPTSHGIFDQALKVVASANELPPWAREVLHFVESRIGMQCVELPTILDWAQKAELTTTPNPSYRLTQVQVSPTVARKLLRRLDVEEADAKKLGTALRAAIDQVRKSAVTSRAAGLEEF
jgi:hypothetical protein